MKKASVALRLLIATILLSGLLAPFTTWDVSAQDEASSEPTSGILQVTLTDASTGALLPGSCWDVSDANGTSAPYCDFDNDGITSFELAPGLASVQQTGGPAGLSRHRQRPANDRRRRNDRPSRSRMPRLP